MAEKRYQIFLSSTFKDLQDMRSSAVNVIMRLGHIPAGMELFPATDQRQWAVIEKAIGQSDYYVLIVGGRYGSDLDHRSYTEAEYDLAVEKGIPIIPLIAVNADAIFQERNDEPAENLIRLKKFRDRLGDNHTCQYWTTEAELSTQLFQGILEAIQDRPREGWVRGSAVANDETLKRLVDITEQRDAALEELRSLKESLRPDIGDIAGLEDTFDVRFNYTKWSRQSGTAHLKDKTTLTWSDIFSAVAPKLKHPSTESVIGPSIVTYINENKGVTLSNMSLFQSDISTIKVHFEAMGLISSNVSKSVNGGLREFLKVSELGDKILAELLARRKPA